MAYGTSFATDTSTQTDEANKGQSLQTTYFAGL